MGGGGRITKLILLGHHYLKQCFVLLPDEQTVSGGVPLVVFYPGSFRNLSGLISFLKNKVTYEIVIGFHFLKKVWGPASWPTG